MRERFPSNDRNHRFKTAATHEDDAIVCKVLLLVEALVQDNPVIQAACVEAGLFCGFGHFFSNLVCLVMALCTGGSNFPMTQKSTLVLQTVHVMEYHRIARVPPRHSGCLIHDRPASIVHE